MDIEEKRLIKCLQQSPEEGMVQIMDLYAKPVMNICRKYCIRKPQWFGGNSNRK